MNMPSPLCGTRHRLAGLPGGDRQSSFVGFLCTLADKQAVPNVQVSATRVAGAHAIITWNVCRAPVVWHCSRRGDRNQSATHIEYTTFVIIQIIMNTMPESLLRHVDPAGRPAAANGSACDPSDDDRDGRGQRSQDQCSTTCPRHSFYDPTWRGGNASTSIHCRCYWELEGANCDTRSSMFYISMCTLPRPPRSCSRVTQCHALGRKLAF